MKREFFLMKIQVSMLGLVVTIVDGLKVFLSDDFNSIYREGCRIVHELIKFQVLKLFNSLNIRLSDYFLI